MSIPKELFDLDSWETFEEIGCADGPKCPWCHELLDRDKLGRASFGKCVMCNRLFKWRTMLLNGLLTWWTRKEGGGS